jgi:hypothetical protein
MGAACSLKEFILTQNRSLQLHTDLSGWIYIVFLDAHGTMRHLPLEGKLFGIWTPENCLRVQAMDREDVFRIPLVTEEEQSKFLLDLLAKYPSVEAYLHEVNTANIYKE